MRDNQTKLPLLTLAFNYVRRSLPVGGSLPEDVWRSRHQFLVALTWFHVVIIALTGPVFGYQWNLSLAAFFEDDTVLHTIGESLVVALFAAMATWSRASRTFRSTAVGCGLMTSSAIIVHLSGGYIEFHFHFFVMLVFLALYQDWVPYLFAVGFVAIHHGVVGILWPSQVYNHPAAINAPWTWAGIHAFFVLWSSVGSVIAWRFNERAYAQTKLILDSAAEGIFGLNPQGITTFINPAAAKMLGLDEKKAVGEQPLAQILNHTEADGSLFPGGLSPISASLKDGKARQGTNEIFHAKNGTSFPADYDVTPMVEGDELTGLVVTFRDTTERNRADREIHQNLQRIRALHEETKKQAQALEKSNRIKDEFLSVASHELKTPLIAIMGYARLLEDQSFGTLSPEYLQAARVIKDRSEDLSIMIRSILEVTKLEAGAMAVEKERVDVKGLLDDLVRLYDVPFQKDVTVRWNYDGHLPKILTDGVKLKQILQNLVNNALKFTDQGHVTISARPMPKKNSIEFQVADTGIGISEESMPVIFEKFRQADSSENRNHEGIGLGLYIVKQFTDLLGGSIGCESKVGRGSTFKLFIPDSSQEARDSQSYEHGSVRQATKF
jgi:PAS domain S-box-containing protein